MPTWLRASFIAIGIALMGLGGLALIFDFGISMLGGQDKSGSSLAGLTTALLGSGLCFSLLGLAAAKKR